MNFLAHPENAAGQPHLLKDHLCIISVERQVSVPISVLCKDL